MPKKRTKKDQARSAKRMANKLTMRRFTITGYRGIDWDKHGIELLSWEGK